MTRDEMIDVVGLAMFAEAHENQLLPKDYWEVTAQSYWRGLARAAILATLEAIDNPSPELLAIGVNNMANSLDLAEQLAGSWRAIINTLRMEIAG